MKRNKLTALLLALALPLAMPARGGAEELPRVIINVTNPATGAAVPSLNFGDVVRVTVFLEDIPDLSIAVPSIHFNPDVLRVCAADGTVLPTVYGNTEFYLTEEASLPAKWGGVIRRTDGYYPFMNNETGVIGVMLVHDNAKTLIGKQAVYSVYMKAVGVGGGELRLSTHADGDGDPATEDDYDYALYNGDPENPPRYLYPNVPFASVGGAVTVTGTEATVYTRAYSETSGGNACAVGGVFTVEVRVKNADALAGVSLPLTYDIPGGGNAVLLDASDAPAVSTGNNDEGVIRLGEMFTLVSNGQYPKIEVENRYLKLALEVKESAKTNGELVLGGADTLICAMRFRATERAEYPDGFTAFATYADGGQYDAQSPFGASLVLKSPNPALGDPTVTPAVLNVPFSILRERSKTPEGVAVIPNGDGTATVVVAGAAAGAEIYLRNQPGGAQIAPRAYGDDTGSAVFLQVPLDGTDDRRVYAAALERDKDVSAEASGRPNDPPTTKVLVSLEVEPQIAVPYGTAREQIPDMPAFAHGVFAFQVDGFAGLFPIPGTEPLPVEDAGWVCGTYDGDTSGTHYFTAQPSADYLREHGILTIDALGMGTAGAARQPVYVNPRQESGGGGGG
ncbi:MAG: hypothetical protein LBH54_02560, partial [Clostridiales bacterium]|nr:hypothetical protein [Clostridiales bacterium]